MATKQALKKRLEGVLILNNVNYTYTWEPY
jgi:hypothetical protein